MAFHVERTSLEIGGFEAIADYLADDYQLGERIAQTGKRIAIAACPVETSLGRGQLVKTSGNIRFAGRRTIRVSQSAGYAGSVITQAALWCIVANRDRATGPIALICYAITNLAGVLLPLLAAVGAQRRLVASAVPRPLRDGCVGC